MTRIVVRQAGAADVHAVSAILTEAASWLEEQGTPLWNVHDLSVERLREDVSSGFFILAEADGKAAGTLKYQMEDPLFWPDAHDGDSAFVHRVAVRRDHAGGTVSTALLTWAVDRTRALGRPYLRLDCETSRNKLRQVYERFGFQYHSDRHVGPYHVARYQYVVLGNLVIKEVDPQGEDALALLREAAVEARELYPGLSAPDAPWPANTPTPNRGTHLVAYLEGEPVACGALRPIDDAVVEVRRMFVVKRARRRGLGRAILRALTDAAGGFAYKSMRLETGNGFVRIEPFGEHVDDPTSVCYEKNI